ncbi:MAG: glycoside hydrolase family 99-like domain-containing protein [Lentisphaeria bacterium]|nr:glycoside hydrolase family 99-like domain-containing protein [Lentisphaeria bacterium]
MKNKRPEILAYYFPNWHVDPLNEKWHGKGWTEWNVTKYATPRFPGHKQPKKPLGGYDDEADPAVMEKQIDTAVKYGVDGFMFDWYYYGGPYRNRCLEEGLMKAANADKIKFAVMWCNHDAIQAHPGCRAFPNPILASGTVTPEIFRSATQYCMEHYFSHPSYLRVDGRPVFSIYNLKKMAGELGVETMRVLLDEFRSRVRQAGLGELHLNAVHTGYQYDNNGKPNSDQVNALLAALGLDSRSGHSWSWGRTRTDLPCEDYGAAAEQNIGKYRSFSQDFQLPYNPVMMPGWDSSPRTVQSDIYDLSAGYPFTTILTGSTPAQFEKYLRKAKEFIDSDAFTGKFLMLHSWNEWTEGAFLLPDEENGWGRLEAVRKVFGAPRA